MVEIDSCSQLTDEIKGNKWREGKISSQGKISHNKIVG
jgi:hypothetical protein